LLGHKVTVFEKDEAAGGMLRYGIPEYRLPYPALDKDIGYIESLGVEIKRGVAVGSGLSLSSLRRDFDAVYISTASPRLWPGNPRRQPPQRPRWSGRARGGDEGRSLGLGR